MKETSTNKGSVILPTLLIIMIIAAAGGTYLTMSFHEYKMSVRNVDLQGAINLAEGGVEDAILAMKQDKWSGWSTVSTDHYYKKEENIPLGNGKLGTTKVYLSMADEDAPIMFVEGVVTSQYGEVKKQIRLDLGKKGLFANGLVAKKSISWNGNNVTVDSYHSGYGDYDPVTNRNDQGTVASLSVDPGVVSSGNGDIWGYLATGGGAPNIGSNGSVLGKDSPSGIKVDPERIADDFYAEIPDVETPTASGAVSTIPESGTIGISTSSTPSYYKISSFSNSSGDTLVIDGPVVVIVDEDWTTKGEIQITNNGSVEMYISGDLDIGGNGIVNLTNKPEKMVILGTNTVENGQTMKISGNGALKAAVYAPNANLEMKGGGNSGIFLGAAVANQIKMTGNSNFHYDEALKEFTIDKTYKINRWRELVKNTEKVPLNSPGQMAIHAVSYTSKDKLAQIPKLTPPTTVTE